MSVRIGTRADFPGWLTMRQALWPEASDERHRKEMAMILAAPEEMVPLLYEDASGRLLGFAEAALRKYADGCLSSPVGYLEGWYVVDDARRQGVGGALMRAAEDWVRGKGCTEMASDTEIENRLSRTAHGRLGYEEVGEAVCFRKSLV